MVQRMVRTAENLVFCGLVLLGVNLSNAAAESRSGNTDLLFSYARGSDRLVFSGLGQLSDPSTGLNAHDRSILYMQILKTGAKSKVFEALNGNLGYSAISPSGTTIAVQVNYQIDTRLNPKLLVLSAEGKEITAFAKTRDFAWSPDSRFLAYTTGDWVGIDTFRSSGTWIYDQHLNSVKKIYDKGEFVAWSPADTGLYIWDISTGVYSFRYDPHTEKIVQTNLHGIFFSPTGRYYHTAIPKFNEGGVEVYDTQSNQPILRQRPRLESVLPSARIVGWAPEGDVLILEVNRQDLVSEALPDGRLDTVLYDVAQNIARLIEDDSVIGWQNGSAILHAKGKFTKRPLGTIPILPEQAAKPLKLPPSDHLKTSPPPQ